MTNCFIDKKDELAFAHGAKDSIAIPQIDSNEFVIDSKFIDTNTIKPRSSSRRRTFADAIRPRDYFAHYFYKRLEGAKGTYFVMQICMLVLTVY